MVLKSHPSNSTRLHDLDCDCPSCWYLSCRLHHSFLFLTAQQTHIRIGPVRLLPWRQGASHCGPMGVSFKPFTREKKRGGHLALGHLHPLLVCLWQLQSHGRPAGQIDISMSGPAPGFYKHHFTVSGFVRPPNSVSLSPILYFSVHTLSLSYHWTQQQFSLQIYCTRPYGRISSSSGELCRIKLFRVKFHHMCVATPLRCKSGSIYEKRNDEIAINHMKREIWADGNICESQFNKWNHHFWHASTWISNTCGLTVPTLLHLESIGLLTVTWQHLIKMLIYSHPLDWAIATWKRCKSANYKSHLLTFFPTTDRTDQMWCGCNDSGLKPNRRQEGWRNTEGEEGRHERGKGHTVTLWCLSIEVSTPATKPGSLHIPHLCMWKDGAIVRA